ncbi:AP endonuclease [Polychaeton citri CBS 116435]|uniref:Apurinic-apyrimidinic endonuclease 1 n=1 Tax=Polychaeton citri CBS 116435 TaxID=1314669 RepID=A0A9P4QD00_9PEZI|nr:AP endonuclease [Polychaeton citri CBS 116435]
MPLAARTTGHMFHIGAHVSSAGGVHNCVANGLHIGANAFALFLRSQRKWANPPLAPDVRDQFLGKCKAHGYDQARYVVPHGSYLVNLAHTDAERTEQAYASFVDDLKRCRELGILLYNFHPGNCGDRGREESIKHLAGNINRAHRDAETGAVVALLENMASAGEGSNVIGGRFEDLRDVIALVDDKKRVGICLDTCHAFAAGYDLRNKEAFEATMKKLEEVVGLKYLRAVHMNDSKAPLGSYRDLHANIGTGFLGLKAFHSLMNDKRFEGLPLVLETPIDVPDEIWAREIKLLESLVGMDVESDEFKSLEKSLAKKGEVERDRIMEQVDRKREKDQSEGAKKKGKKTKALKASDDESSSLSELEEG